VTVAEALEDVLVRHGLGLSAAQMVAELDAALVAIEAAGKGPLSLAEAEFLAAHGGTSIGAALAGAAAEGVDPGDARAKEAAARVAETAHGTYGIAELAAVLGVDRSRVSHLLAAGRVWAFKVGRSPCIPRWQVADGRLLPGLDTVVRSIPAGITPPSLAGFMLTSQAELEHRSPVDYLACGGDPAAVAALVAALGEW
jgi:hypothetical protein